ncbi:MAG: hypothetical protein GW761_12475 [Leptospira sp.]|nr:hypothetical protein [Leptospira sp.]
MEQEKETELVTRQLKWWSNYSNNADWETNRNSWGKFRNHSVPHITKAKLTELVVPDIKDVLMDYLSKEGIQKHTGYNNLKSSWVLCANLYFLVRSNPSFNKLMLGFLKEKISDKITEITELELEFAFPQGDALHPENLLGEKGGSRGSGQTSPDIAFIVKTKQGKGIILTECKYTETSFYKCSARKSDKNKNRETNHELNRCLKPLSADEYSTFCHQKKWGRKYMELLKFSQAGKKILKQCPAATNGYQLFRQQALAEGIATISNDYDLVVSSVAFDQKNTDLINSLKPIGVDDFQSGWANIFEGKALFKTWTHQEWVQYVRTNRVGSEFNSWLQYIEDRYGY